MNREEKKLLMKEMEMNCSFYEAMVDSIEEHFTKEHKQRALNIFNDHYTYYDDFGFIPSLKNIQDRIYREDEERGGK